jgi:outer membrane receptor protein involved in Fe transport
LSPSSSQSTFQKFGNPDLNPETTVAYELGVQNQFTNDDVLTITAYYKDIFDYVSTRQARLTTARLQTGNFVTYINQDYARSRGIEVEFKKRVGQWFRGTVSGSYSLTTGKSSTPDQGLLVARGIEDETIKENYVVWDRPLQFNVSTTFNVIKGQPLIEGFEGILDDITVYVRGFYQSGKRYTPVIFNGYLKSNNRPDYIYDYNRRMEEVGEDWFWIDMNIEKYFKFGGFDWVFSIIMKNVLDNKNSTIINPVRGKAYEWGDDVPTSWNDPRYPQLQAPVSPYPVNPVRYLAPRNFQLGLSVKF